jgi:hypothetical protein
LPPLATPQLPVSQRYPTQLQNPPEPTLIPNKTKRLAILLLIPCVRLVRSSVSPP